MAAYIPIAKARGITPLFDKMCRAGRMGRRSGWGIQLQNLPQNHIEDLEIARQFVKKENVIALQMFFENPTDVLSQLLRTAFVAVEGSRFIVADFSAIEARVLAWLADEQWQMDVFLKGGGVSALKAFGADKMGLSDEDMQGIIDKWRKTNKKICNFWRIMESCAKFAVRNRTVKH